MEIQLSSSVDHDNFAGCCCLVTRENIIKVCCLFHTDAFLSKLFWSKWEFWWFFGHCVVKIKALKDLQSFFARFKKES